MQAQQSKRSSHFRPTTRLNATIALVLAVTGAGACSKGDGGDGSNLRSAEIPRGFDFATSRPVALEVRAAPHLFGPAEQAQIEVRRADGAAIFRGAIRRGETAELRVRAPTADRRLSVVVTGLGGQGSAPLSVDASGRAEGEVR
jgi:hypothetical protein